MSDCNNNTDKVGLNNPLRDAVEPADYSSSVTGDNTIENATCDSSVYVGAIVRVSGGVILNAQANNSTNSRAIGICVSKSDATTCNVLTTGYTSSILSGLSSGANYFLSSTVAGALTTTAPTAAGEVHILIGRAYNATQLILRIGPQTIRS